jgi:hypothetical protein
MKKEEIVKQLEAIKEFAIMVNIDKVIALINQIEPEQKSSISFEDAQIIVDKIERSLDRNSEYLVNKDSAEFNIGYENQLELESVDLDIDSIMEHVKDAIDEFVVLEEDEEENDEGLPE